jgi:mono/diheme cytochrome c family protein
MHGQGTFIDPRINVRIVQSPDLVTPKLPALRAYQHSIGAPPPPAGSFDAVAAERGRSLFNANCVTCHVGATLTDNNSGVLHSPSAVGQDGRYAMRTAAKAYRTTPLRALWQHAPYFHDGSAKTLADAVEHYNRVRSLSLSEGQKRDLVEYLKSL